MQRRLVFAGGIALWVLLWIVAAREGPIRVGSGVVLRTGPAGVILRDHGHQTTLLVGNPTMIIDAAGRPQRAAELQPGDQVEVESLPLGMGRFLARRITMAQSTAAARLNGPAPPPPASMGTLKDHGPDVSDPLPGRGLRGDSFPRTRGGFALGLAGLVTAALAPSLLHRLGIAGR